MNLNYTTQDIDDNFKFISYFISPIKEDLNSDLVNNSPWTFRRYIIPIIQKNYTIEQFYKYEKIFNSLFWNLKIFFVSWMSWTHQMNFFDCSWYTWISNALAQWHT